MLASGVRIFDRLRFFSLVLWRLPSSPHPPLVWRAWVWEKGKKNQAALSQMLGTLGPLDFPGFAKPHFEPFSWALSIRRPLGPR